MKGCAHLLHRAYKIKVGSLILLLFKFA